MDQFFTKICLKWIKIWKILELRRIFFPVELSVLVALNSVNFFKSFDFCLNEAWK